jgi:FG-GAP-like repeat
LRLGGITTFAVQAGLFSLVLVGAAGAADPSFAPGGNLSAGRSPTSFAAADVNRDGHLDFAVANQGSDDVTVLLGDGAGVFSAAAGPPAAVGDGPVAVANADLNGDGNVDLAVANGSSNDATILLGNGAGGFGAAPGSPLRLGGNPADIAAADLNGDGHADLALSVWQDNWRVAVLLGDGAGGFTPAPGSPIAVGAGYGTARVALDDLNGDGKRDLIVAPSESRMLAIRFGDGTGRFGAAGTVAAGNSPSSLTVADLNRDGKVDLAVGAQGDRAGRFRPGLTIMLGNGAGGFRRAPGSPMAVPGAPTSLVAADLNADRRLDVAVANSDAGSVTVLLGNGAGRFRPAIDSPFPVPSPTEIAAADLNADGGLDFAVAGPAGFRILFRTPSTPAVGRGRALRGRTNAVFPTRGLITMLAADGNRVAVKTTVQSSRSCGRIVVWTVPGRRSKTYSTNNPGCLSILCQRGSGCVDELALGGGQVAWISRSGGNTLELMVITARLSGGAPKRIEHAFNGAGAGGDPKGEWVGRLLGGGSLLAYNGWRVVCDSPHEFACDEGRATLKVTNERIVRIAAGRRAVVRRGPGSRPLAAVGGDRMALEAEGAVVILGPSGARVATVPSLPGNPPRAVALSRTRLAVSRTFTLDLHNPATGGKVKSLPLGPAAALQLVGVNSRLALLRGPRRLVLVRLSDGKLVSLPITSSRAAGIVDARLTEAGLFYAYNVRRPSPGGRIVFQPSTRLLARF